MSNEIRDKNEENYILSHSTCRQSVLPHFINCLLVIVSSEVLSFSTTEATSKSNGGKSKIMGNYGRELSPFVFKNVFCINGLVCHRTTI